MGITTTIVCDACESDLTTTGNSVDYRLRLSAEPMPSRGGAVTDMMIYPPVDRTYIFCGMRCLDVWRAREVASR